jgi:flagellar biosynthesis anti-sigma factor FlgM
MRIDAYNLAANDVTSDASLLQAGAGAKNVTSSVDAGDADRTTLSPGSASPHSLVSLALNSPAIRQDKVDSLTQSIESGEYELDPAKIAAAMVDEYA